MTRPLRIGLVGAGMVAQYHIRAWRACPGGTRRHRGPRSGQCRRRGGDGARRAALPVICGHARLGAFRRGRHRHATATHAELIAEAQNAGLHAICQKPLAPDAAGAHAILRDLRSDTRVMLHENWRWRPTYRALAAALASGRMAPPRRFEFRVESAGFLPDPAGRLPALERQPFLAQMPRLLVFELLVHHLDTLLFLFGGDIEVRRARLARRSPAVLGEDFAEVDLVVGGVPGRLVADFCVPSAPPLPRDRLIFDGRRILDGWRLDLGPAGPVHLFDRQEGYQASFNATIAHFAEALATGSPFATGVANGCRMLVHVDEIYAAAHRAAAE